MTIAPNVGCGTYCIAPVAKTGTKVITAAPTIPVIWDLEPACSATAVRDPLVLTGKPWKKPAAMLARADADHLLVAAHLLATPGGERRCGGHGVRERDYRDRDRSQEKRRHIAPADAGNREGREALRDQADRVDAALLQVEGVDGDGGQHHDDRGRSGPWAAAGSSSRMPAREATPRTAAVAFASPSRKP